MTPTNTPALEALTWLMENAYFKYGTLGVDTDEEAAKRESIIRAALQPVSAEISGGLAADIKEALENGDGFWKSCGGCYETNEGYPTAPVDPVFKCELGSGCSECGGIGAIWDTTDYAAMGDALSKDLQPASGEAVANPWREAVIDELVICHILTAEHESDPRKALSDAIQWNVNVALDPAVSKEARELMGRGWQPASGEPCPSSMIDKTVCVSESAKNERQTAPDEKPVAKVNYYPLLGVTWTDPVEALKLKEGTPLYIQPQPQSDVVKALEFADDKDFVFLLNLLLKSVRHEEDAETQFWIATIEKLQTAIKALQPASGEPVAWGVQNNGGWFIFDTKDEARSFGNETGHPALPLYTTTATKRRGYRRAHEKVLERLS